jgi:hypothetical protein
MKLEDCQFHEGEKAIFYCNEGEDCPFSTTNFLYCEICNEEELTHKHKSLSVYRRVDSEGRNWMMVKSRAN